MPSLATSNVHAHHEEPEHHRSLPEETEAGPLGSLAIAVPPAGLAANIVVAWLLVLSGVAHLVFGWRTRSAGGFLWELLVAILYVGVGGYLLTHPAAGLKTLTLALAIYLFAEGVLELILSRLLRALPGSTCSRTESSL